jgi:hypothetical protein
MFPLHGEAGQQGVTDLSGSWSIDIYLSDHAEQIARAIEIDTGEFRAGPSRGPEPKADGGAPPASDPPRQGPARQGRGVIDRMSDGDRKALAELIRPVQFPPLTLELTQSDKTLTIFGDREPYEMRTDGKVETHAFETGDVNRAARWTGPQLRVTYQVGHAGTLTYTYAIVPTTGQLLIRINFERVPGQPGPFEIKLVYNRSKASIH